MKLFTDDNWQVRQTAVLAVESIRPEDQSLVPAIVEMLKDKNGRVQCAAASALQKVAPKGPELKIAVAAVGKLLEDDGQEFRYNAACTLGNMGPDAKSAVPALDYSRSAMSASKFEEPPPRPWAKSVPLQRPPRPPSSNCLKTGQSTFRLAVVSALADQSRGKDRCSQPSRRCQGR